MDSIKKKILSTPLSPPSSTNGTNSVSMQKSNHVSTVMLYGIPIVSLYIEGQERLCLAQISNTLLKQFSYNEIHNRRVALGITCVQCTPVQLEILRRAGAMPVSSRRCGMITRREAERLCKSFLGDNTPPRLPDDFAFSVQHRCAWGCRGAFLPSRYNSSRAKCIKCNYCGLFFSPNKFIFHSHRISASDKYVQPDAANFNSWRRHMTLCGQPQEEVTHAWEDVKAMFNGGTRKRLVNSSVCGNRLSLASPSGGGGSGAGASTTPVPQAHSPEVKISSSSSSLSVDDATMPPKRALRDEQYNYGTVTTAAAVVGVTAVSATVGAMHPAALPPLPALGSDRELALMPFSRNLVMDYMWNQQQQQLQQHQQQQHQPNTKKLHEHAFGFGNCTLPWLKSEVAGAGLVIHAAANQHLESCLESKSLPIVARRNIFSITKSTKSHNQDLPKNECAILNSASAFKPVQQTQLNAVAAVASAALLSTSVFSGGKPTTVARCTHGLEFDTRMSATTYLTSQNQTGGESLRNAEQELIIHSKGLSDLYKTPTKLTQCFTQSDSGELDVAVTDRRKLAYQPATNVLTQQQSNSADEDDTHVDDDDIMVDIETTEDDTPQNAYQMASDHSPSCTFAASNTSGSTCNSPSNIDVDSVTTEADSQYSPSLYNNICSENSTTSSTQVGLKQCLDLTSANSASKNSKNDENFITRIPTTTADIEDDDGSVVPKYKETHESRKDAYRIASQTDVQQTLAPKTKSSKLSERSTDEELNEDNNNDATNNKTNALKATLHLQPQQQQQLERQQQPLNYHQATLNYKPLNVFQHEWSYPIGNLRHYFIQETSTRTNGVG